MGLSSPHQPQRGNPQVQLHPNARLTPSARRLLVDRVDTECWPVARAARAAGVSRQTALQVAPALPGGRSRRALGDRSSRPRRIPVRTPQKAIRRMEQLRRGAARPGGRSARRPASRCPRSRSTSKRSASVGSGDSTRSRILLGVTSTLRPAGCSTSTPRSSLASTASVIGSMAIGAARGSGASGYEVVFVCVDDHNPPGLRGGPSLGEWPKYATLFFRRALRWFESLGIHCERLLTDNARCYTMSKVFLALCAEHQIKQSFTRPYTPKTNGKAERFIQTLKRRWAYRQPYRSSAIRAASLPAWIKHYNHIRPHRELGKKPPFDRLREARQQRA